MDRDRVSRGAAMLLLPSLLLLLPPPSLPMLLPLPHLHAEPRRRRPGPPLPTLPHRHAERRRLRSGPPGRRCLCCHVATRKGAAATRARPCLRRNIVTWNGGGGARPAPAYAATLSGGTAPPPRGPEFRCRAAARTACGLIAGVGRGGGGSCSARAVPSDPRPGRADARSGLVASRPGPFDSDRAAPSAGSESARWPVIRAYGPGRACPSPPPASDRPGPLESGSESARFFI